MPKVNLSVRFTLILSTVFLIGSLIGGTLLWRTMQNRAQQEIDAQGLLLIEAMNAVRGYTSTQVRPLLADQLAVSPEFISETVPAFSARSVFKNFQSQGDFQTYQYKEAAFSPTNPLDKADEFEAVLLQKMINESSSELSGYRTDEGVQLYYIARPLTIGSESCLECHSTPEQAPASLIATYGDEGGFGWSLGQTVATQIIYVPAEEVFNSALQTFMLVMIEFITVFALIILLINVLLRRYVIEPVKMLGGLAQKISADENFSSELENPALHAVTTRSDELGSLAGVFHKMAAEVQERTGKLKEQVQSLIIKIDQIRRKEQVSEVVDSEFFNDLQNRASEFRKKDKDGDESPQESTD